MEINKQLHFNIIGLFGKSGAGKDYILQKIKEKCGNDINTIVADTTRPPRSSFEVENHTYNFLSTEKYFKKFHYTNSCFNGWYYGIPLDSLSLKKPNLTILSINDIQQLYNYDNIKLYLYYISSGDKTRILRQLNREKYPNISEICRRFLADEEDFKNLKYPFYHIRNTTEEDAKQATEVISETIYNLSKTIN